MNLNYRSLMSSVYDYLHDKIGGKDVEQKILPPNSITLGLCAMEKKVNSKPMKEILKRLFYYSHISILIFDEDIILHSDITCWPLCDVLISFYSSGFPLKKAIEYANLRKPYLINDLESQFLLHDRESVYMHLKEENIPVPRFSVLRRDDNGVLLPGQTLTEHNDKIEVNGMTFNKPFVEKPVDAEDHDIYIYMPPTAGGGQQRLFRKVNDRSSKYFPISNIRRDTSYIYEEFMPTDGTDVKVYTVGNDYAHAEARKSPALDGKVERDKEGKEMRYPVILTPKEKYIAKRVTQIFKQQICGFDLLRAYGVSYVCDVNGFSFVKTSQKYYDDCGHILGMLITKLIAPNHKIQAQLEIFHDSLGENEEPFASTIRGTKMELRSVIAVIRHGDRTPKQKVKVCFQHQMFMDLFKKYAVGKATEVKLKKPEYLQEVLDIVRTLLSKKSEFKNHPEVQAKKTKLKQIKTVLELYGCFSGFNRKVQLKYQEVCKRNSMLNLNEAEPQPAILMIMKWGGELTESGRDQAEELGKAFRYLYPGADSRNGPDLGVLRLHSTYRHDLKIYASDEGRVQMTAAAFTKGFLDLEGELPPILIQMVKSANTNGLLDNDNDSCKYQRTVKKKIEQILTKDEHLTPADYEAIVPTRGVSLVNAMKFIRWPKQKLRIIYNFMVKVNRYIKSVCVSGETWELYQSESWDLLRRRWTKLQKDFLVDPVNEEFDIANIPDIYDNIKYDIQHNIEILHCIDYWSFYANVRAMADIIIPQEYGTTIEEKLFIARRICSPLLRKILSDVKHTECTNSNPRKSAYGSKSPSKQNRFVRSRFYFTSESHIHSLLTILRYGHLANCEEDTQWRRAMQYVSCVPEINYLSQIVFMIYEDPSKNIDQEDRFHVELHFSPGMQTVSKDFPQGRGYMPKAAEKKNEEFSNRSEDSMKCLDVETDDQEIEELLPSNVNTHEELEPSSGTEVLLVSKFQIQTVQNLSQVDSNKEINNFKCFEDKLALFQSSADANLNYLTYPFGVQFANTSICNETSRNDSKDSEEKKNSSNLISFAVLLGSLPTPVSSAEHRDHSSGSDVLDPSLGEIVIPHAPRVPDIYPLETLHNALTVRKLFDFLSQTENNSEVSHDSRPLENQSSPLS